MTGTPGGEEHSAVAITRDSSNNGLGVGFGMKPPQFLKPGNTVEVIISKIGTLKNTVEYE